MPPASRRKAVPSGAICGFVPGAYVASKRCGIALRSVRCGRLPVSRLRGACMSFALGLASGARSSGLRAVVHEDVVHQRAIARPHFDRLHPLRLGKVRRHVEVSRTPRCPMRERDSPPASRGRRRVRRAPILRRTSAPAADPSHRPSARPPPPTPSTFSVRRRSGLVRCETCRPARPRATAAWCRLQ